MQYSASRVLDLQQPTVWCMMKEIAQKTKSVDFTNGTASGSPPDFYMQSLKNSVEKDYQGHIRQGGSLGLVKAIAKYHQNAYPNLDPQQNIQVVSGAHVGMYLCCAAFINPDDQIIVFDPSYSYYRKQSGIHQGKVIGIPLTPKHYQSRQVFKERINKKISFGEMDEWEFDKKLLKQSFSKRTKIIVINSPHNPTGKIFSNKDLDTIAQILRQNPQTLIVEDNIYESFVFDKFNYASIKKLSQREEFKDRCLSIYSAGKLFKATGVRLGWILGAAPLIKMVRYANQHIYCCSSPFLQKCIQLCLFNLMEPENTHNQQESERLQINRDIMLRELALCQLDIGIWVPQSGYFVMIDISKLKIDQKYRKDENGNQVSHDYACAFFFAYEYGISTIPCSSFFQQGFKSSSNYLRLAFCKDKQTISEMGKRLKKNT